MRLFYNVLVVVGLPFVALYWLWRALADRTYRRNWHQRFGFGYPALSRSGERIWIHAVSVGEVQAAAPLVNALRERLPAARVLVTTVTPTGADRVRLLFGDSVSHAYAPYDVGGAVRRFYDHVRPDLAVIIETELWPNLYHAAGIRDIPLVLASARISPRSMPRYQRLVGLFREALSNGIIIAAQSELDRQRFVELGAPEERTFVCGNIKFDFQHAGDVAERGAALREALGRERPVWVAASTHAIEEDIIIAAHRQLLARFPTLLLILVPRHPARFDETAESLRAAGLSFVRRTSGRLPAAADAVLLGDTMGEVNLFYASADIAFVGGSLVPVGGHNLLEPAALSLPVLAGPHLFNAEDIAEQFTANDAVRIVEDEAQLTAALSALLGDAALRAEMGRAAGELVVRNKGAVAALLERLEPLIDR